MRSISIALTSFLLLAAAPVSAQHLDLRLHQDKHHKVELTVAGAQKGMPIYLFVGTKAGHTNLFKGNDKIRPLTIGLAPPFTVLLLGAADAHGMLKLSFQLSGPLPKLLMQAVSPALERHGHGVILAWRLSRVVATRHD